MKGTETMKRLITPITFGSRLLFLMAPIYTKESIVLSVLFLKSTLILLARGGPSADHHAKLILIDEENKRYELSGRQCHGGVFLSQPRKFKCACIFGVWGVYGKYCEKPLAIFGGSNECFKIPANTSINQFIIFGNPDYPFEPIISHFREDYKLFTKYYAVDTRNLDLDASAPFLTISNHNHIWELESDSGETICLLGNRGGLPGKRFCYYNTDHWSQAQKIPWDLIVRIRKGCRSNATRQYSTKCINIPSNPDFPRKNGLEVCEGPEIPLFQPDPATPSTTTSTVRPEELIDFPLSTPAHAGNTTMSTTPANEPIFDFPDPAPKNSTDIPLIDFPMSTTEVPLLDFPLVSTSTSEPITTTDKTYPDICLTGITRDDVRAYWSRDEARDCPAATTDAVFVNQLQRFAVLKMNALFDTRVRSLQQISELLTLIFTLMTKTCPEEAVDKEFLEDATSAFTMFVKEDFFYGVEELEADVFQRFTDALQFCIERATVFNISMESAGCDNFEVTGKLYRNDGKVERIEIPPEGSSKKYEPIIETVWKLFLNAHSYCYPDFQPINDHHHFSTLFFSIFSESIYEKWNSAVNVEELYRFVTPSTKNLALTMRNLDYCVGATNLISTCQTWLDRKAGVQLHDRKKRSVWEAYMERSRNESRIWNGIGHCLHSQEEPAFKLGYGKCSHPV